MFGAEKKRDGKAQEASTVTVKVNEDQARLRALDASLAIIEFEPDGTIIAANRNFLDMIGYSLDEIRGKHHRMLVDPVYANGAEYKEFWAKLGRGERQVARSKRSGRDGKEIWIEGSYSPVYDEDGKLTRIVNSAADVTEWMLEYADLRGQVEAINKSQAVVEFELDGTIVSANDAFLKTVGYTLNEIRGKHHSMFVPPADAQTEGYKSFWGKLSRGEFQAGQYRRVGKGGKEIWLEATYNPIFDLNNKSFKVVKYATDVTAAKMEYADLKGQVEAINKSQAVVEFEVDGTIVSANDAFLKTVGYTLNEIRGKHHSMFVPPADAQTEGYKSFWGKLSRGEFQTGQYRRLGKGGKEIWLEASYNPIFDLNNKPFKVVKYATDLTKRKQENAHLADQFERTVKTLVDSVSASSAEMQRDAETLAAAAEQTNQQSVAVATATDELSASINEISRQVSEASRIAAKAMKETEASEASASDLVSVAGKIGEVTEIITEIAGQTNLLALNATIEAARAGEHGKGFSVVASEVKQLAQQTAKATGEITQQIKGIQASTESMARAMREIAKVISIVSEVNTSISSAVEEQSAATSEVASNINGVRQAADDNGRSSLGVLNAARDQFQLAERLQEQVNVFLKDVRAM